MSPASDHPHTQTQTKSIKNSSNLYMHLEWVNLQGRKESILFQCYSNSRGHFKKLYSRNHSSISNFETVVFFRFFQVKVKKCCFGQFRLIQSASIKCKCMTDLPNFWQRTSLCQWDTSKRLPQRGPHTKIVIFCNFVWFPLKKSALSTLEVEQWFLEQSSSK